MGKKTNCKMKIFHFIAIFPIHEIWLTGKEIQKARRV